jgi:hypothetical protein
MAFVLAASGGGKGGKVGAVLLWKSANYSEAHDIHDCLFVRRTGDGWNFLIFGRTFLWTRLFIIDIQQASVLTASFLLPFLTSFAFVCAVLPMLMCSSVTSPSSFSSFLLHYSLASSSDFSCFTIIIPHHRVCCQKFTSPEMRQKPVVERVGRRIILENFRRCRGGG